MSSPRFVGPQHVPPACPACDATRVRLDPTSRSPRHSEIGCRECGRQTWAARPNRAVEQSARQGWVEALEELRNDLAGGPGLSLFDIDPPDYEFLALARAQGFIVSGNAVSAAAVELARERYGIELRRGGLGELCLVEAYDALTMLLVLAQVEDVDQHLEDCWHALKPGGILFLRTPRWLRVDRQALVRISGDRVATIVDRWVAAQPRQLHTADTLTGLLRRHGFVEVRTVPRKPGAVTSTQFLEAFGVPAAIAGPTGRALDAAVNHGPAPRMVLDVFARKPA